MKRKVPYVWNDYLGGLCMVMPVFAGLAVSYGGWQQVLLLESGSSIDLAALMLWVTVGAALAALAAFGRRMDALHDLPIRRPGQ